MDAMFSEHWVSSLFRVSRDIAIAMMYFRTLLVQSRLPETETGLLRWAMGYGLRAVGCGVIPVPMYRGTREVIGDR